MGYYMAGGPMNAALDFPPVERGGTAAGVALARALAGAARPQVASAITGGGGGGGWGGSGGVLARAPAPLAPGGDGPWVPGYDDAPPRYRRMNPLNPRALRRSMRRVQAFAKFARKTISFTQRVKMKKRRK